MKFLSVFVLAIAHLTLFSQNTVTINGSFSGEPTGTSIVLENYLNPAAFKQTAEISDNKFSFTFDVEKEEIFKLSLSGQNFLALVINPGEKINLTLDPENMGSLPVIEGSPNTEFVYEVQDGLMGFNMKQDSLNTAYQTASAEERKQIEADYFAIDDEKNVYLEGKIKEKAGSLAALFFIEQLNIDMYFPLYEEVDSLLSQNFPDHPAIQGLHNKVVSNKATAIGSVAPDFTQLTPEGEEMNLYSIKDAKIIIIDFWASWCRPCRAENPNMVSLYADYHEKGLEIFGVSLDKDSAAWVRAISSDKLTWPHVSDLKGWKSSAAALYGVGSIPSMFVIDGTNYKILAKNIRGAQLREFVSGKLD
ncbi:MAG: hypothetical protein C0592_03080 [Marinilabiliales bacterium]|nr:MAG: hypothetical protein C0592_03080 [Marinilabiliales bacterium]